MKWPVLAAATVLALGALAAASAREASARYEEPAYAVVGRQVDIELREYGGGITAQVTVSESRTGGAADNAFRILAGYIFGKNTSRQKIAMTVPVTELVGNERIAMTVPVTTQSGGGAMRMSFFMPSKYSVDTLPTPLDDRIKLIAVPPIRYAVIKFSGLAREESCQKQTLRLLDYMREHHLEADGPPLRAFYNPPWTLPFLRRNEVWIPLRVPPVGVHELSVTDV